MRREGLNEVADHRHENAVDGVVREPRLMVIGGQYFQGDIIATLGTRSEILQDMVITTEDRVRMTFTH